MSAAQEQPLLFPVAEAVRRRPQFLISYFMVDPAHGYAGLSGWNRYVMSSAVNVDRQTLESVIGSP
jgi:hypothetical protein